MKMKRLFIAIMLVLPIFAWAQDYDFSKKIGGNTLYFIITSTGGKNGATVEVTYPGATEENGWKGYSKPSGQLSIPEKVTPDRTTKKGADPEDDDTTIYTVTTLNYYAFKDCSRLTRLTLPPTVKSLGEGAFAGCKRLEYIVVEAPLPPKMDDSAFDGVDLDIPLRVPTGSYERYKDAVGWRLFTEILEY